jgi:hypothetical protein
MSLSSNTNIFIMEAGDNALLAPNFNLIVDEPIVCSASAKNGQAQTPTQFSFQFNGSSLHTDYANWQQFVFSFRNYGADPHSGPKGYSVAPFVETWSNTGPEICNSSNGQNAFLSQYGFKEYFFDSDSIPAGANFSIDLATDASKRITQVQFIVSVGASQLLEVVLDLAQMRSDFRDQGDGHYTFMTAEEMSPLHVTTLNIVGQNGGSATFTAGAGRIVYRDFSTGSIGEGTVGQIKWVQAIPSAYRGDTTGETSNMGYATPTQLNGTAMVDQTFAFIPVRG